MHPGLTSPANNSLGERDRPDTAGQVREGLERPAARRHDGNFVIGCLVGGALATVLWAAIGFAAYRLL